MIRGNNHPLELIRVQELEVWDGRGDGKGSTNCRLSITALNHLNHCVTQIPKYVSSANPKVIVV
jgi:hypothetical protein